MSSLKKNIIFNFFGQGVIICLGFISFKFIYSGLGEDALGIIYFSLMISAVLTSSLDMGLSKTTVRELALYHQVDQGYITKLIQTFSLIYWLLFTTVVILFIFMLPLILNSWINLNTMDNELAYYVLLIIVPSALLTIPKSFLSSICIGLQRMDVNNSIDITFAVIQQTGIIFLLVYNGGIVSVAYWLAFTNIVKTLVYLIFITKLLSFMAILPKFSFEVFVRIKEYTSSMMWISLVLVIHKQLDKILISKLLPIGMFGIYSFVFTSISKTTIVTGSVAQAAFPFISNLDKQGKRKELLDRFLILQDFLIFGTVPIFVSVIFFSVPLFSFLLDADKALLFQLPVVFLSFSFYFHATLRLARTYLLATNKPKQVLKADILALFIVTPSTFYLVFTYGVNGAALSWCIFHGFLALLIVPRVYKKEFLLSPYMWFRPVFLALLLSSIFYIPTWLLISYKFSGNLLILILGFFLSSILYCVTILNVTKLEFQRSIVRFAPLLRVLIIKNSKC